MSAESRLDSESGTASVERAVEAISIIVDNENRKSEADLVMAAGAATPETIAFFLAHASGIICVPILPERADELALPLMVAQNTEVQRTALTVSVDASRGTTAGISASDRARTIAMLKDLSSQSTDFNRPGHVLPLRRGTGGVLKRTGPAEATIDLVHAGGLPRAEVLCELVFARRNDIERRPGVVQC
ncbi:MAG TPA: 3,4-dihydroxy-2-butanone-4-phosphate synthase [Isosphaeraceae bacterium]|nr:3,4-dihydroxy-2-butanone-4-phosphate synthase [Isosphaeraceae bacterium]